MIELAVELGNTYTTICRVGYGIVLHEPTLVAVSEIDGKYVVKAFGEEAALLQGKSDASTTIFSPISSNRIISPEYAELFLADCLEKVSNRLNKNQKPGIVFCVPVTFDPENRAIYESMALSLGITDFKFAPSVVFSALSLKSNSDENSSIMIVDMGGGKCDIAVVRDNEVVKGVSIFFGGKTLDSIIMKILEENFSLQIGTLVAKKIKEEIASLYASDTAHLQVVGKSLSNGEIKKVDLISNDILPAIEDYFEKIANAISFFVAACPSDIASDIEKNGVYVCGGLSNISNVRFYLMKKQKSKIKIPENNDTLVMDGAQIAMKNSKLLEKIVSAF